MHEHGFHQLTMEHIAEQAEYSKGTVYQHFACKEEILIQLCIRSMKNLHQLALRATEYPGSHREQLLAFVIAHGLWQQIEPNDIFMLQNLHGDGVLDKVSEKSREQHHLLEQKILQIVISFFDNAIRDGQLPVVSLNAKELVYGLWSMCYGGQLLCCYQRPLVSLELSDPAETMISLVQVMLDGLDWQPRMSAAQSNQLLERCRDDFFAAEIEQSKRMNSSD
jgi:AcrR family transcriptional regulator